MEKENQPPPGASNLSRASASRKTADMPLPSPDSISEAKPCLSSSKDSMSPTALPSCVLGNGLLSSYGGRCNKTICHGRLHKICQSAVAGKTLLELAADAKVEIRPFADKKSRTTGKMSPFYHLCERHYGTISQIASSSKKLFDTYELQVNSPVTVKCKRIIGKKGSRARKEGIVHGLNYLDKTFDVSFPETDETETHVSLDLIITDKVIPPPGPKSKKSKTRDSLSAMTQDELDHIHGRLHSPWSDLDSHPQLPSRNPARGRIINLTQEEVDRLNDGVSWTDVPGVLATAPPSRSKPNKGKKGRRNNLTHEKAGEAEVPPAPCSLREEEPICMDLFLLDQFMEQQHFSQCPGLRVGDPAPDRVTKSIRLITGRMEIICWTCSYCDFEASMPGVSATVVNGVPLPLKRGRGRPRGSTSKAERR